MAIPYGHQSIDDEDVRAVVAALTGDWNPIHTDAHHAAETMFGQRIAHGLLGLSIASGLADRLGFIEGTVGALLGLNWKFKAPVFIGDTIRLAAIVKKKRAVRRLGGGIVTFRAELVNQGGKVCQKGDWDVLVLSRPDADASTESGN